jgi:hypothetical protein
VTSPTYAFYLATNMLTFDPTQYTGGSVTNFSSTEVDVTDSNGDTAAITGNNFSIFGPSGTVTGAVLRNAEHQAILIATHLNLDLNTVYNDRGNRTALFADLFNGGVVIDGSKFNDTLVGGTGRDILRADGGADVLIGGAGADVLAGGAGNSTFRFLSLTDSTPQAPDLIFDFHAGDKIDIAAIATADHVSFHLGATAGHTGDVVVSYDSVHNRTVVKFWTAAASAPNGRIDLLGNHSSMTASDFIGVSATPAAVAATPHHGFVSVMAAFAAPSAPAHLAADALHAQAPAMIAAARMHFA